MNSYMNRRGRLNSWMVLPLLLVVAPAAQAALPARTSVQIPAGNMSILVAMPQDRTMVLMLEATGCKGSDVSIGERRYPIRRDGMRTIDAVVAAGQSVVLRCDASCTVDCTASYFLVSPTLPSTLAEEVASDAGALKDEAKNLRQFDKRLAKLHRQLTRLRNLLPAWKRELLIAGHRDLAARVEAAAAAIAISAERLDEVATPVEDLADAQKDLARNARNLEKGTPGSTLVRQSEAVYHLAEVQPPSALNSEICPVDLVCGCCPSRYLECLAAGQEEGLCAGLLCTLQPDCNGQCSGEASYYDQCGVLCGDGVCPDDPEPTPICLHVDLCGVCGGNGSSCAGCDGVPNSGLEWGVDCNSGSSVCGGTPPTACPAPVAATAAASVVGGAVGGSAIALASLGRVFVAAESIRGSRFASRVEAAYARALDEQLAAAGTNPLHQGAALIYDSEGLISTDDVIE